MSLAIARLIQINGGSTIGGFTVVRMFREDIPNTHSCSLTHIYTQAIQGYRETEKSQWLEINQSIMERLQKVTSSAIVGKSLVPLPAIHVLDLAEDGHIEPHIDSIKVRNSL